MATKKKLSDVRTIDELAKMFGITPWDDIQENISDNGSAYGDCYRESINDGATEEEAEKHAIECEEREQAEYFHNWYNAASGAIEHEFDEHGLSLVPASKKEDKKYPYTLKIVPHKSWEDAAAKIIETINGVGEFEFASVQDFLELGPYTAREAVLSHLGWLSSRAEVYGDTSAARRYENAVGY